MVLESVDAFFGHPEVPDVNGTIRVACHGEQVFVEMVELAGA